jgi:hypothetical protein
MTRHVIIIIITITITILLLLLYIYVCEQIIYTYINIYMWTYMNKRVTIYHMIPIW